MDTTGTSVKADGLAQAATDVPPSGDEAVAPPSGYENEDPAGEPQSAAEADLDIKYAKAAQRYRSAKAEFEEARQDLVDIVQELGVQDSLLAQRIRNPRPTHNVPLPMTAVQIREHMGWTTTQVNDWLKYRLRKGSVRKRGRKRYYVYYYPGKDEDGDSRR